MLQSFNSNTFSSRKIPLIPNPFQVLQAQSKMLASARSKPTTLPVSLLFIALISPSFLSTFSYVQCSPPIDYFVYTSQLATAHAGTQNVTSILPALKSIYTLGPASVGVEESSKVQQDHLDDLAARVLELIKNTSHTHDNDQIDLETASMAWHLMERQANLYMRNRVLTIVPFVNDFLAESQVSQECHQAVSTWLDKLANLDQWATLMWNSWGEFPPSGLFEGSFTDLGSYRGCLSVSDNDIIGQAQYCTMDFQPIIPSRPRFHSIFKKVLSVDKNHRLIAGDFEGSPTKVNSQLAAHEFTSSHFFPRQNLPDQAEDGVNLAANKYNKRTIVQNGTDEAHPSSVNLTLKSEALIELAHKAHYFYYVKFRLGACLPSKCSQDDVQKLSISAGQRAILQANPVNCMKKQPAKLNNYQLTAIWILSSLACLAVIGTVVDLLGFKDDGKSSSLAGWLLVFSMHTNAKRLFNIDSENTHSDLECIHGLRFFSMMWVIYGHTVLYTEYQAFTHFFDVVETRIPSFILLPTLNANFSVDTFFVISGILTTYVTWEYTKGDSRKFNKFAFLISRYIRLTPQFAIVMLCFFILPLFGDGPMYRQVTEEQAQICYDNWWINLLYMQSYINSDRLCIDPSWWLSIEMSFHVLSVIVVSVMISNPSAGMMVNFVIAAFLTVCGAIIHYSNGMAIQYLPSIPQRYEVKSEQTKLFFHRPYPHAAAYFIGIALGYALANRTIKKLSRSQLYQGWFVCSLGLIMSLWGSYFWNLGASYTQLQATLYYNLCQLMWPLSIAWIILACSLGHGGFVKSILSAKTFIPLGRITYMTYLSHSIIVYYHSAVTNIPVEPSVHLFVYVFMANAIIALALGVALTVVYESPILNLQKYLFNYLTTRFDPTRKRQAHELPTKIVCDKNGSSASAVLLPTNQSTEIVANGDK